MEPFTYPVQHDCDLLGRRFRRGDSVVVYPGLGIRGVVELPANYGAVLDASIDGPLEPTHSPLELALAVGLESPALSRHAESCPRHWGERLRRARSRLSLI